MLQETSMVPMEGFAYISDENMPKPNKGFILLVDDEILVRKTIQRFLEKSGYRVETAENGIEAIRKLECILYDLVITDLKMPELDGRELLKMMADRFGHIPRIVLTAVGSNEDILLALKTGAYDFISKPIVDFALLGYTIERALERKRLNDERNRAVMHIEKVNEIISMLNRGLDTADVFKMLSASLKTAVPFNRISLIKVEEDKSALTIRFNSSDRRSLLLEGKSIEIGQSALEKLIQYLSDIYIVNDLRTFITEQNLPKDFLLLTDEGMKSAIIMSIIVNDHIWGLLLLASEDKFGYNESHTMFLRLIAGQVALGVQRGELLAELEMHTKHLEHLVKIRTYDVLKTQKTTIFALSRLAEMRDNGTGGHLNRMRNYCVLLAQLLKYTGKSPLVDNHFLRDIYDASILHDIGKVGIQDYILLKEGPLTTEEFEIMKKHPVIGHDAINDPSHDFGGNSFLEMAKDIILYHHESWDGKGYPKGLKADDIPLSARIVTVCDLYDALTSKRPYKEAFDHHKAISIMKEESRRFDPLLLRLFLENNADFDRIRLQFI
jgi:response regulator RpfG family c-di-GMP phosphodiesterase